VDAEGAAEWGVEDAWVRGLERPITWRGIVQDGTRVITTRDWLSAVTKQGQYDGADARGSVVFIKGAGGEGACMERDVQQC
jgi:hypothetical protein